MLRTRRSGKSMSKKILALVALLGVMSIGLVGCSGGDEAITEGDAANAAGTTNSKSEGAPPVRANEVGGKPAVMEPPK